MSVPFGGIKFSRSVSGFGASGISTGQFEFDLWDEFGQYSEAILAGASARLYETNVAFLPSMEYYISKRSVNDKICHITAYDIMSEVDKPFDAAGFDTYFERGHKTVDCHSVLNAIKSQCGFSSIGFSDAFGTEDINFTKEQLQDTTCRRLLETVADAMCGCWAASGDDGSSVRLNCFGESNAAVTTVHDYAEINMQGKQKITGLVVTDSESGERTESLTGEYGTVFTVDTPFAEAAKKSWKRVQDKLYTAWRCEKALLTYVTPDIPAFTLMKFGERELMATSFTISVDSTGVYFSGGADPQDEEQWRYEDYTQRALNERVQIGKTVGNSRFDKNGFCFVNKNRTSGNSSARKASARSVPYETDGSDPNIEKYGFSVGDNGVTVYDGDMVSSGIFESAEKIDDNTVIISYPGFKIKYTKITEGNKVKLKKEIIREGDEIG